MTYCMLHRCYIDDMTVREKCCKRKNNKFKCRHLVFLKKPLSYQKGDIENV